MTGGRAELNEGLAYDGIRYVQGGYLVPITFSLSFFCPSLSLSFTSHHITFSLLVLSRALTLTLTLTLT